MLTEWKSAPDIAAADLERKDICSFEIKDAAKGEVTAVVNTLNMVDRDGDVILSGAIANGARVKMSSYAHGIIQNAEAPVGKGTISIEGDRAVFKGQFFLGTQRGREAFETVKALGGDSEWSIGYRVLKTAAPTDEWKSQGARRMLSSLQVLEVSPVFMGANGMTGTLAVKEASETIELEAIATRLAAETAERVAAEAKAAADAEVTRLAAEVQAKAERRTADEEFARFQRTARRFA